MHIYWIPYLVVRENSYFLGTLENWPYVGLNKFQKMTLHNYLLTTLQWSDNSIAKKITREILYVWLLRKQILENI